MSALNCLRPSPYHPTTQVFLKLASRLGLALLILSACLSLRLPAQAQTLTILHAFSSLEGGSPFASLIQGSDGNFYGTTAGGGDNNAGTVFRLTPDGALTTLYTFSGGADGSFPEANLVQGSDGNFYGTTAGGGDSDNGTVFRLTPGGTLTTLHAFSGGTDGASPIAGLVQGNDGNFYGTVQAGGDHDSGTVFRLTPDGTLTTLHTFSGGTDGAYPAAGLVQGSDGSFYGTTQGGGGNHCGTVFRLTAAGILTTLYTFSGGADGSNPSASVIQGKDGNFYGTTMYGGDDNSGTVFCLLPNGTVTTLHSFSGGADGSYPESNLVQGSDGSFYGTALYGGESDDSSSGSGTVFRLTPDGTLTTLHTFSGGTDGAYPAVGLVQGSDGSFYGTTILGGDDDNGSSGDGTVFRLPVASSTTSVLPVPSSSYTAMSVSVGADGNSRLLWNKTDGTAAVWKVNSQGAIVANVSYSPYVGWSAKAIATGNDNNTHVLWTTTDGTTSVYLLNANNQKLSQVQYGPYSGWSAKAIAVAPDNTVRLLWTKTNGTASLYRLDSTNHLVSQQQYGPYDGWTAKSVTVGSDGLARLLWTNTNGTASVWKLNAQSQLVSQQQFGPYTGWTAQSVASAPNGTLRLVWLNTDNHIALWTLSSAGQMTTQLQYGPFDSWSETSLAVGSDGNVRLLWDNVSGQAALWSLNTSGSFVSNSQLGPY